MARLQARRAPRFLVPLAAAILLGGCGSAPPGPSGTSGPLTSVTPTAVGASADPGAAAGAAAVLAKARLADEASLEALESVRFTAAGTEAARELIASGASGDALWAATYVYASASTDPAPLLAVLANTAASPSVRAMAAAGLVGGGEAAGFEPLIASLSGADAMEGAAPAGLVWEFSASVLERYTLAGLGPDLAASDADRATARTAWEAWLTEHAAALRFDAATQLWVAS